VGCEYEYTVMNSQAGKDYEEGEEEEGRAYPASSEAHDHDHEAKQQRKLRNASSVFSPSSSNSNNNNNNKKGTASHQQHQPDWANGLPPDFVEMLATHLKDSCCEGKEGDRLDWGSVQDVYNAAAVCTRWRDFIQRSCFLRTSDTNNDQQRQRQRDSGRTKIRRKKTLADEMLCHPHQLLEKAATNEDVIKCYIVRERHKSPFCSKKYRLKLGADYLKANGKTLLVAHHQLLATKSAYNIYLSSADGGYPATQRLAQLHSSPYGTLFELHSSKKTKSGSIRRTKSGDIKYTFNMLGGRGPRSVQVNLTENDEREEDDLREERSERGRSDHNDKLSPLSPKHEKDKDKEQESSGGQSTPEESIVLENKLPRWHELLQCWCLDFGGRVKCASVKNFQLVSQHDPEEIILQFGKVDADVFTMDFKPKLLSAQQAFMICLSTFDSKLSCF
jgi:hypothetical protein